MENASKEDKGIIAASTDEPDDSEDDSEEDEAENPKEEEPDADEEDAETEAIVDEVDVIEDHDRDEDLDDPDDPNDSENSDDPDDPDDSDDPDHSDDDDDTEPSDEDEQTKKSLTITIQYTLAPPLQLTVPAPLHRRKHLVETTDHTLRIPHRVYLIVQVDAPSDHRVTTPHTNRIRSIRPPINIVLNIIDPISPMRNSLPPPARVPHHNAARIPANPD